MNNLKNNNSNTKKSTQKSGAALIINENTCIQSPYLYLQASGSIGIDSSLGNHLRWAFRNILGDRHLPKGDQATSNVNFNKPEDFVRVYKAAYRPYTIDFHLYKEHPIVIDDSNRFWIYRNEDFEFYLHFRDEAKYDAVRLQYNPLYSPIPFIEEYGNSLLELESRKHLFFSINCDFEGVQSSASLKIETLSVEDDRHIANKIVSNRKFLDSSMMQGSYNFLQENGRSIRWQIHNAKLARIQFEFYSSSIEYINNTQGWETLGDFALTPEDSQAFYRLEPQQSAVHKHWYRFNDEALVNIQNYKDKWNDTSETDDKNIKDVVKDYISLSNDPNNYAAIEEIPLNNNPNDPDDYISISHLDMLLIAANDYHIARMLGLGTLDLDIKDIREQYVYLAEYFTYADLEDGQGEREVHHLFMSLPTSGIDSRLPVPIELDRIVPGVFIENQSSTLTDDEGYTQEGTSRYISLFAKDLPEDNTNPPFFLTSEEINLSIQTIPVYGGLKYRKNNANWAKPELSHDIRYQNIGTTGDLDTFETRFLLLPSPQQVYFVHKQQQTGTHRYLAYGINWFSRASIGTNELSISTNIQQKNTLVPPSNSQALLIREENPLLLTSQEEQNRWHAINDDDKTLIRLSFDYHSIHELKNYNIPIDSPFTNLDLVNDINNPEVLFPDNEEIFANEIEIFFRDYIPQQIIGKALTITHHSNDISLAIITTSSYEMASTGELISPAIEPGTEANYVGGIFTFGEQEYIIQQVVQDNLGPIFTVYKKEISNSIFNDGNSLSGGFELPISTADGLFMAIENMQSSSSWGLVNPIGYKIQIGDDWVIHRELIESINEEGEVERKIEKARGIWGTASINTEAQANLEGIYKVIFDNYTLAQHPQFQVNNVSVEWHKGILRAFTENAFTGTVPNKTRKVLNVLKIEHIGTNNNLVLYVQDPTYSTNIEYDSIQTGSNLLVNFYPSYKIYLYKDTTYHLTESKILPEEGKGIHYSIFGFRSKENQANYLSKISIPTPMFAQEIIEALPPEQPEGVLYATRPDFFGRASYTFTTKYQHKPYGVLFYRTNDEALLNALYEKDTIVNIRKNLNSLGGNEEEYLSYRWKNFLNFEELATDGDFKVFPPIGESPEVYKFPNPDKQAFFDWANHILSELDEPLITEAPGSLSVGNPKILQFVKRAIYNAFVPLTEVPILYQYLNGKDYQLVDKPQVIKDRNGHVLKPGSDDFDIAPMMKITEGSDYQTLFTDFKLDGTSNNLYFYGVKELSTQMNMSDFSPFLGPIKLVNTNAPEAPEIKRIIPVLENLFLGITPHMQLEINAYPKAQNIKRITIYRANSFLDAQSVQTMQQVKIIDLEEENLLDESIWTVTDNFEDLIEIPFGDGLFYKVTVSREVSYADRNGIIQIEYTPSQASKLVASLIVEVNSPQAPILKFISNAVDSNNEIHAVSLKWSKTAYKAKYHLYKMNNQGNWTKIHQLQTNEDEIELSLADTDLQSDTLKLTKDNGQSIYHHFKIVTENTAGMLSTEENILSIFNEMDWIEK